VKAQAVTIAAYMAMVPSRPNTTSPSSTAPALAAQAAPARWRQGTVASSRRQASLAAAADNAPSNKAGRNRFSKWPIASKGPIVDVCFWLKDDLKRSLDPRAMDGRASPYAPKCQPEFTILP